MNCKLTLSSRLFLVGLMPQRGSLGALLLGKSIVDKVSPTAQQLENANFREVGPGQHQWEDSEDTVGYDFVDNEVEMIQKQLRELDAAESLVAGHIPLVEAFGLGEE